MATVAGTDIKLEFKDKGVQKLLNDLLKQSNKISDRKKEYANLVGVHVLADIFKHFENERGPQGRWWPWSKKYREYMSSIGKGGNKILQDTGKLKNGWQPARYRTSKDGILWYNPVKYARKHDEGLGRMPQRKFTWLSDAAMKKIEDDTVKFLLK